MKQSDRGFTLIELMIAVAVVAILAAVAFPSYQDSVRKTRRADGKAALERVAALQERWFTENNTYTNSVNNLGGSGGVLNSTEGFYSITVATAGCTPVAPSTYIGCFQLTATAIGAQASDAKCATFTLDETGDRNFTGTGTATDCW